MNTLPPGQPELWILISEQSIQPQHHGLGLAAASFPVLPGAAGDAEQLGRLALGMASRFPGSAEIIGHWGLCAFWCRMASDRAWASMSRMMDVSVAGGPSARVSRVSAKRRSLRAAAR